MKRVFVLLGAIALLVAGCNGSSSSSSPTPSPATFTTPTNASLEAVDCKRERAFVPIFSTTSDAEVAVIDLSIDPDTADPRIATVDLGHGGIANGAAIAPKRGVAMIISGLPKLGGYVDEIDEKNNQLISGSPFPFPAGSAITPTDGIVYDSRDDSAIVSMTSNPLTCSGGSSSACTGMAAFDLVTNSFGTLIQYLWPINNFAVDANSRISIASSDPIEPLTYAIDVANAQRCTLEDDNLTSLSDDNEGTAVDPSTGIWVIGQFAGVQTPIINLADATFEGTPPSCTLNEFGAPPSNSIVFNTNANDLMPGVTINPETHRALLTGLMDNDLALIKLPKERVSFIDQSEVSAVTARLPLEPDGKLFQASIQPYADTVDTCHNRAYIVNAARTWMAEVDLQKLESDPNGINTILPSGNCAGTSTTYGCDNGHGVRYFPLPGA